MASRDIADCHPDLQRIIPMFLHACHVEKIDILIYCTYRSNKEQDELYAIGRTKPGQPCMCGNKSNKIGSCKKHPLGLIVTNAKAGQSKHNFTINGKPASKAFDFVPLVDGKPQWNNKALYLRAGEIAEKFGLEWAGRWTGKLKETAHCQI